MYGMDANPVDPVEVIHELGTQVREGILASRSAKGQPYYVPSSWTGSGALIAVSLVAALSIGYIMYDKWKK